MSVLYDRMGEVRKAWHLEAPCHGCGEREVGCHGRCGLYAEFRAARDEINRRRNEAIEKENAVFPQVVKCAEIARKRRRTR